MKRKLIILFFAAAFAVLLSSNKICFAKYEKKDDKTTVQEVELQKKYVETYGNLPLVLGIPGFRVPGFTIPQEQHFGKLKQVLSENGIPYYCVTYDSDEYPLRNVADLSSETYSIAATRVIPSIVRLIKLEQERRKAMGLPEVKDVVLFMYSQGTVVSYAFVRKLHYFKREYDNFAKNFGVEREAIKNDPLFQSFVYAIDSFTMIKNIQVQREKDFMADPDLRLFYDRSLDEMDRRYKEFESYLINPSSIYSGVSEFDPPETLKYPKQYIKLKQYALECKKNAKEKEQFLNFIKDYSLLREVNDINFMYFSASGSIFGSPLANSGYDLLVNFPVGQFVVKGLNQIKDTRVGSFHHTHKIESLVRESKLPGYPITKENTLFVVGVNGEKGDDYVDQPSAHISGHCLSDMDLTKDISQNKNNEPITVKLDVLPELPVVALNAHHFPIKTFWGLGPTLPGSACIDKNHPTLPYLMAFINKDFNKIDSMIKNNKVYLRQFMVEFTFRHITGDAQTDNEIADRRAKLLGGLLPQFIKELDVKIIKKPHDINMQGKFFNADNLTYVLIGAYDEGIKKAKPQETDMSFLIRAKGYDPITLKIPVKPGKITFIKVKLKENR